MKMEKWKDELENRKLTIPPGEPSSALGSEFDFFK